MNIQALHEKAIALSKQYREVESGLLDVLISLRRQKGFGALGYADCFTYCLKALKLSEAQAYYFSKVSAKVIEVPELKEAIDTGRLSLSQARRIVPVLSATNHAEWIERAVTLPQRELERQVATVNPKAHVIERVRPVAAERVEMKVALSTRAESSIRRARDLLSQRLKRSVTLEETLQQMAEEYVERHDPVRRAERAKKTTSVSLRKISRRPEAASLHAVNRRDQGCCQYRLPDGTPCQAQRWTEVHHLRPWAQGGDHQPENLLTLCKSHHRAWHASARPASTPRPPLQTTDMSP